MAWKMLEKRLGLENIAAFMGASAVPCVSNWQNVSTARDMVTYMQAVLISLRNALISVTTSHTGCPQRSGTPVSTDIDEAEVGHWEGDITGVPMM